MAFFATSSSLSLLIKICSTHACARPPAGNLQPTISSMHAHTTDGWWCHQGLSNITCGACAATQMCGWKRAHKRVPPSEDMHVPRTIIHQKNIWLPLNNKRRYLSSPPPLTCPLLSCIGLIRLSCKRVKKETVGDSIQRMSPVPGRYSSSERGSSVSWSYYTTSHTYIRSL